MFGDFLSDQWFGKPIPASNGDFSESPHGAVSRFRLPEGAFS